MLLKTVVADRYVENAGDWQTMRERVFLTDRIDGHKARLVDLISDAKAAPFEAAGLLANADNLTIKAKSLRRLVTKMIKMDSQRSLDWLQDQTGDVKKLASSVFVSRAAVEHPRAAKRILLEEVAEQDFDWVMAALVRRYAGATDTDRRKLSSEFGPLLAKWLCEGC